MSNKLIDRHRLKDEFGYIHRLNLESYDDRIDVNPEISLFEYGLLRQSKTGKTLFWYSDELSKQTKIEKSGYIVIKHISEEEVRTAITDTEENAFKFFGSSKEVLLEELSKHPNLLAHIINDFNSWNGYFTT